MHEIKHDGFRVIARKIGKRVRLYSRPGNDLTYRTATRMESPSTGVLFGLAVAAFVVIAAVVLLH